LIVIQLLNVHRDGVSTMFAEECNKNFIISKLDELSSGRGLSVEEAIDVVECIAIEALKNAGRLSDTDMESSGVVEFADEALDKLSELLNNSALPIDLWDELWEVYSGNRKARIEGASEIGKNILRLFSLVQKYGYIS